MCFSLSRLDTFIPSFPFEVSLYLGWHPSLQKQEDAIRLITYPTSSPLLSVPVAMRSASSKHTDPAVVTLCTRLSKQMQECVGMRSARRPQNTIVWPWDARAEVLGGCCGACSALPAAAAPWGRQSEGGWLLVSLAGRAGILQEGGFVSAHRAKGSTRAWTE